MLTPSKHPLAMSAGTTFEFAFRLKQDGQPAPMQGSVVMQVRKRAGSPAVLAQTLPGSGEDGWVAFAWPAAQTQAVQAGVYVYAVDWVDAAGRTVRLFDGALTVTPDVIT